MVAQVGLGHSRTCLLRREQPPIQTVANNPLQLCWLQFECQVDDGAQRGRTAKAPDSRDVLLRDVVVRDDHLLIAQPDALGETAIGVEVHVAVLLLAWHGREARTPGTPGVDNPQMGGRATVLTLTSTSLTLEA